MEFDISLLNDAQLKAMQDTEGPVLVLAGAGSGKTRVLTYRVAHLVLDKKVPDYNILAITFTNKATHEMRERLSLMLGENHRVWISTIHSLCCNLLREHGHRLGYSRNFSIYDENDTLQTIKQLLKAHNLDEQIDRDDIRKHISKAKNMGLAPNAYYERIKDTTTYASALKSIYEEYEQRLVNSNSMDFDDLLVKMDILLSSSTEMLTHFRDKFKYLHVDEFQDTNAIQFSIVRKLAGEEGNVFVVGDDDQSIYGWRGADITNILHFDRYFKNVKIHKLLQNYRSTKNILEASNNVINNNDSRHDKQLFTNLPEGEPVMYYRASSVDGEVNWVASNIKKLLNKGYQHSDIALLVRFNWVTRPFELMFNSNNIPYTFVGGYKFFDRKEIQDVLAYMRIISNFKDRAALERIINFPKRGIGDVTLERIQHYASAHDMEIMHVIADISNIGILSGIPQKKMEEFRNLIADINAYKDQSVYKFADYLVKRVGFEQSYKNTGKEDDIERWENICEFVQHTREFSISFPDASIDDFLQTMTLNPATKGSKNPNSITISTTHSAKGLEFKAVFIVSCDEGTFPSYRAVSSKDKEEERRIMYVAITRAKERLYISYPSTRYRYNETVTCKASSFIYEALGGKPNPIQEEQEHQQAEKKPAPTPIRKSQVKNRPPLPIKPPIINYSAPVIKEHKDLTGFREGANVVHPTYGKGQITLVTGTGGTTAVTVSFPNLGLKKYLLQYATLDLLD
ncbi:MAG: UvrD-helicase domain-containing protein [Christensenellaceae bacterium]|jgi:DNA helicase-2/ATP-dependent DNA helicase PcrA|nr:UvrD-helicase domain-containing protein [Christensenellaceae bacterium]